MFVKLGRFLANYAKAVLVIGVILIALAAWYGSSVFSHLSSSFANFSNQNSQSWNARQLLEEKFPGAQKPLVVLFSTTQGQQVKDPATSQKIQRLLAEVPATEASVESYFTTGASQYISNDGKSMFATVMPKDRQPEELLHQLRELESDLVDVKVGGQTAINLDVNEQVEKDLFLAEIVSFSILAVLLVVIFRSFVAALLPLLLGGVAILGAFSIIRSLTGLMDVSNYAINIITLVGLGLAIDYSLFVVGRFREELQNQPTIAEATKATVATAGRTVFFSGLTVIVSLLSLLVFPLGFLQSMAWGGSAAVLVAMLASLTVLPALLMVMGHKVNALSFGKVRRIHKAQKIGKTIQEKPSLWYKTGKFFMRRPWPSIAISFALLLIAGLPFLRANLSSPDHRSLPETSEARQVSEATINDFNINAYPIQIAYKAPGDITEPANISALYEFTQTIKNLPNVESVESLTTLDDNLTNQQYQALYVQPQTNPVVTTQLKRLASGDTTQINISYTGLTEDSTTQELVREVSNLQPPENSTVLIGGEPAELYDMKQTLAKYIPYGLAVIIAAMFVLLFLMLGSVVIPIKAIIMNFISLSAAYGVLVLVFQDGYFTDLFNFTQTGALDAAMPVLIFAIAFGMSMDYSVFLYRQYDKSGNNEQSVLMGLQKTGPIITSAAVLLFVVVAAFATARIPLMQQVGLGLSLTILIDAFLVRMVLVPSLMKPIGDYNWWAPKRLKRLQQKIGMSDEAKIVV